MQNKFGLKDLFVTLLLLAIGLLVLLKMVQDDRRWTQTQGLDKRIAEVQQTMSTRVQPIGDRLQAIEQQLEAIQGRLSSGAVVATAPGGNAGVPANTPSAGRDESWKRPDGPPVYWCQPFGFTTDPYQFADCAPGGEFCEIFEAKSNKLTPLIAEDVYARRVTDLVCNSLGGYDPRTLKMEGELADAWQYDTAGLWLRVRINPKAVWSDGRPVTADDVIWTFNDYLFNPQLQTEAARSVYNVITGVSKVSERVVEFTFKEAMFSNRDAALGFYILPRHFYEKFTPSQLNEATSLVMGSGPYKLARLDPEKQWSPGEDIVLVRNENYWAPKPPLERLRFKAISEDLARLTAYRNREGDMMRPVDPQFAKVTKEPDWDKHNYSLNWVNMRSGYSFIAWQCGPRNGKLTPFSDKRVRRAMTMLLDREKMLRDINEGIGVIISGPGNPSQPSYNNDIKPLPYDVPAARALLKEAGWEDHDGDGILDKDGVPFVFEFTHATSGEVIKRIANFIKDSCAAVGIDCRINPVDWARYDDIMKSRNFDALTLAWSATSPESDPNQIWHSRSIENQGNNFGQWRNAKSDELIDRGRREMDDAKRAAIWREWHAVVAEDQPYTFIRALPWLRFVNKDFKNVQMYPKGIEYIEFYRPAAKSAMN